MNRKSFIEEIFKRKDTVFSAKEIALILGETNKNLLKSKINYYIKKGVLKRIRRGIYVKTDFDIFELATKIYSPSYISLETVLEKEGVIFQHYKTVFVVSYLSRKLKAGELEIQYRKIKNDILLNPLGIKKENSYAIATKERAFLDALYLYKNYYFDNLDILDKNEVYKIAQIYKSRSLIKKLKNYF